MKNHYKTLMDFAEQIQAEAQGLFEEAELELGDEVDTDRARWFALSEKATALEDAAETLRLKAKETKLDDEKYDEHIRNARARLAELDRI